MRALNLRSWVVAASCALALSAPFVGPLAWADDSPAPAPAPKGQHVLVAREGDSFLEEIDGQRVLHLSGDFYSMGLAHGKLLKEETRECVDAYLRVFALGAAHHTMEQLREIFEKAKPHIPQEYLDEMRGLAEGAGVPLEEVQIVHIVPELHHCSGAAVFGKMTTDGKLYHYRSLDYSLNLGSKKKVQENACLIVRKPSKGYASVVVGWAGTLGCVTGMSAEGISIGEMGSSSLAETFTGTPMWFRLRWILENCRTLDEGLKGFSEWKRTCGYNFIIADGKIPDARAVEVDANRVAFFAPGGSEENVAPHWAIPECVRRVNHFVDPELAKRQRKNYDPAEALHNSWDGYKRISEYLEANKGKLDGEGMISLCRGYPKDHSCLHQAVFCPTDLRFWVANAKDPSKEKLAGAQNQTFFPYDLKALLAANPTTLGSAKLAGSGDAFAKKMEKSREDSEKLAGKLDKLGKATDELAKKVERGLSPLNVLDGEHADDAARAKVLELLHGEPTATAKEPALPTTSSDDEPAKTALDFMKIPGADFPYRLEETKTKSDGYKKYSLRYLSAVHTTDQSDVVTGNYYEPKKGDKIPGVVVVHHLGGGFEAEEMMAAYFADEGIAAITIMLPGYGARKAPNQPRAGFIGHDDPKDDLPFFKQAIVDVCRAADVLRSRPQVDASRVGVMGISLGALVAADASGFDTRFARTILVIGGGDLFSVIANDSPETHGELDKAHRAGYTDEILKKAFEVIDPDTFAPRLRSPDVLMLNAEKDEVFPRECTLKLWRKAGYPTIKWYPCTHKGIVAHLPEALEESLKHLKATAPARQAD